MQTPDTINISDIIIGRRLREEYGDLTDLDNIGEPNDPKGMGLIEPIILQQKRRKPTHDEFMAMQGKDYVDEYFLMAGGRRLEKLKRLGYTELHHGITCTPGKAGYLFREEVPENVSRKIELYENVARKSMTWKERVKSIEEIHLLNIQMSEGGQWTEEMTGLEVGQTRGNISHLMRVARALRDPKSVVHQASSFTEAMKLQLDEKLEAMKAQSLKLAAESRIIITPYLAGASTIGEAIEAAQAAALGVSYTPAPATPVRKIDLNFMHNGKMEDIITTVIPPGSVDGIYTDWPYGIDMSNIQQSGMGMDVSKTAAEHDHKENVNMFGVWMSTMHTALKPDAFCVIWCDLEHWDFMRMLAESVGFKVQRWPFHWIKTHPCQNGAAQYNQTKTVEHAMILRKGGATIATPIPNNYWIGTFAPGEKKEADHPFAKPRALHQRVLKDFFNPGLRILDPFAGTGSIPLACIENGYEPVAVELVERHYAIMFGAVRDLYTKLTNGNVQFI